MIKLLSHSVIALTLILGFAPAVKPITVSETDNFHAQATITDKQKQATAQQLFLEGYELSQQGTKESSLQAIEKFKQAVPLFRELGKKEIAVVILRGIALTYNNLGETQQALDYYNQALTLSRELNDDSVVVYVLNHIGNVYSDLGEKEKALNHYNQALSLSKKIENISLQASTLSNISTVYVALGEMPKALDYLNQALLLHEELKDDTGKASIFNNLGGVYSNLGEKQKALDYFNQALLLHQQTDNPQGEASTLNNIGTVYSELGEKQKALDYYNQALPIYEAIPYFGGMATTLNNIGSVYDDLGETQKALDYYNQTLTINQAIENPSGVANTLNNIGGAYRDLGETQQGLDYYHQALIIYRELREPSGQITTLNNLGMTYELLGEKQQALDYFNQALSLTIALKNPQLEALILNNLGYVYSLLGEKERALDYYNQALSIRQKISYSSEVASSLNNIASIYDDLGEKERALDYYNQALAIHAAIEDPENKAIILNNIGWLYQSSGKAKKALNYYEQVLSLNKKLGDLSIEATTLNNIGMTYDSLAKKQEALEYLNQALPLTIKIGDRTLEAITINNISSINYDLKNYTTALEYVNRAIEIAEQIRTNIISSNLKASYFTTVESYYKHKINILMKLHQQNPNKGYDVLAFETSEQGKARSLLELLQEVNIDIRQGVKPQLVTEEQEIQLKLNAVEKRRINLCSNNCSERLFENLETERSQLLEQYKQVQAKIRANSPKYAELTQTQPIKLKELQQLLDEDTILWQYSLGKDRSYVWVISKNSFSIHELASREAIETVAREYHKLLQYESRTKELNSVATKLSQLITPPTAEARQKSRIVIVSDGALQYIPFATLPLEQNQSLLTNHQIVNLPSSSVLARLRANETKTKSNKKQLAILADPVFSSTDSRLPQQQAEDTADLGYDPLRSATRSMDLKLARLTGTKKEAESILPLITESEQISMFGFDANLAFATNPELSNYNIVHFATHGILNSEQPELSGIVLSLFDAQGKPQNGFLRLHEIFNLNLTADLVVLSACQTGLGKEIRGEGLVGLTRGFMYAGANKILVSLWSVDDAATAEFMKQFYGFMLQDNLTPASALNATQKYMQNHAQWSHPYYWAAFTLQGDWINN